ncbi:OmpH family outer membrane protein [Psychroflexus sediminis]|uniref:Periplasmic chaperone for outer membrane proteins Skp n=1 Tax=Psychroflexus sediminis TaxID=470826 RepID=A0A1G7X2X6_9FLAO|nr:OmpH family outer membrane protein [Psychroflexus sediminis]SDG78506.1 periplasmic chaperone for outer membrane proteins Skp [Psychroflexus sediminis]
MKLFKYIFIFTLFTFSVSGQGGLKIAYVDMDYILEQIPEYKQASNQLNLKAQEWRTEIESRQQKIENLKAELENERPLLTTDLIQDMEDEISFLENQLLDYRNKRFGVSGDFIVQKRQLIQPIQDQVFNAIQEIGESRDYDFIFENSADALLLFSARRHDLSEVILKLINRNSRGAGTETADIIEDIEDYKSVEKAEEDELKQEEKALKEEERKSEREALIDERQRKRDSLRDARQREFEERRARILKQREERQRERDSIKNARENN